MGNLRSQPCRRTRPMYLLYLIKRAWTGKANRVDNEDRNGTNDRQSDLSSTSSRCRDCKICHYRQDSLTFDSESEMAPNAEEELLAVKPWGPQPEKERLRPPTYNAEDYAMALRRWGRRPVVTTHESHGTLPSTTSSSSGYASGTGEMTLRQFTSVSELLNKLRADLRLAFPSFVQEFASHPADGMTLLLETLRGIQLIQSSPPSGQSGPRIGTRRAALDELGCVECLAACGERCADAPRLLSQAQPGLLALAVCLTSSLNRSRVLALQLLTKVCQAPGGHSAVSEAVSTLRLRYGEGGRFRFLAGALLAPRAAIALRVAGISFLNAFLKSAPRTQTRLYIQAEACEAGLEPRVLQSWLTEVDVRNDEALMDLLRKEIQKWSHNCVDVDALQKRLAKAEEACTMLGNKVSILQEQLDKCNREKVNGYSASAEDRKINLKSSSMNEARKLSTKQRTTLSNAEDEGISSSERSSSPEDLERTIVKVEKVKANCLDNDQETTIDDVIEELRIIVKDAEEEYEDRKGKSSANYIETKNNGETTKNDTVTYFGPREDEDDSSLNSAVTRKLSSTCSDKMMKNSNDSSLKIIIKNPQFEDAIVPAILYPRPPRRAPPCLSTIIATRETDFLDNRIVFDDRNEKDIEEEEREEEETLDDGSDSLLSASRLKYNAKNDNENFIDLQSRAFYHEDEKHPSKPNNPAENCLAKPHDSFDRARDGRTIRNFDSAAKNRRDADSSTKYLRVYEQFEKSNKTIDGESAKLERAFSSRHKNASAEARKSLRRSVSQDVFLDSQGSSPRSNRSRIEGRIRKFESLNAFENSSLRNIGKFDARKNNEVIKRSESFHHVTVAGSEERSFLCNKGGSDSGLVYITDYDLEPFVKSDSPATPLKDSLAKSLNRIDESHDLEPFERGNFACERARATRSKDRKIGGKSSKPKNDEVAKNLMRKKSLEKSSKNEADDRGNTKFLKNDELYDDAIRIGRKWNFQKDLQHYGKMKNYPRNADATMTIGTNTSFSRHDKINNKYSNDSSTVFLPSARYDAFAFGKNRFNLPTKYPQNNRDNSGARKNSNASLVAKRGKVTDVISGLY